MSKNLKFPKRYNLELKTNSEAAPRFCILHGFEFRKNCKKQQQILYTGIFQLLARGVMLPKTLLKLALIHVLAYKINNHRFQNCWNLADLLLRFANGRPWISCCVRYSSIIIDWELIIVLVAFPSTFLITRLMSDYKWFESVLIVFNRSMFLPFKCIVWWVSRKRLLII